VRPSPCYNPNANYAQDRSIATLEIMSAAGADENVPADEPTPPGVWAKFMSERIDAVTFAKWKQNCWCAEAAHRFAWPWLIDQRHITEETEKVGQGDPSGQHKGGVGPIRPRRIFLIPLRKSRQVSRHQETADHVSAAAGSPQKAGALTVADPC
jgi:hypothetical protein